MSEDIEEIVSTASTPRAATVAPVPPIAAPPSQYHAPSMTRAPLVPLSIGGGDQIETSSTASKTPKSLTPRIRTPRFITPIGSPIRRALNLTRLDPQDAWLPITESRNGNAFYAAFHTLCSGIGFQALVLPVAFTILGWTWGIICLTVTFIWQMYTLHLLVQLHESPETGIRYCRYLQLSDATFGYKTSKFLTFFPIMYLSAGTCSALIIVGGSTAKTLFQTFCGQTCTAKPLTPVEWYLVFTCAAVVLSQLPNLNSIAGVSLIGAITAVGYCTLLWTISVAKGRLPHVSYDPVEQKTNISQFFYVLNALGMIAFAFRGHNLILEIQSTMPSSEKHPSRVPMWRGVKFSYLIIAMCLFPIAIGGYWAYGRQMIPDQGGMLTALYAFHSRDTSRFLLGLTSACVIITGVSSFQIYGMPIFDEIESQFTKRMKKPAPWWLRSLFRVAFGFISFFTAVAIPFLGSVSGLIGGIALPVTLAYPCFMWVKMKKPKIFAPSWLLHWALGLVGVALAGLVTAGSTYVIIDTGIHANFFNPE